MYGGCIPFILLAILLVFEVNLLPCFGETTQVLQAYGLVIASFMAGIHWGQYISGVNDFSIYLPITSNIIALLVWVSFLLMPIEWNLITLIFVFTLLLLIDLIFIEKKYRSQLYLCSRIVVTTLVLFSLITSLYTVY